MLRVADQQESQQVTLQASGELEELPFDVEFSNFVGGPEVLEAFRADAADIAQVGDTPPIHAFASGEVVPIVLATQTESGHYLTSSPEFELESLDDLEGARIAYAEGTAQASGVLRALDRAGLDTEDVELVRVTLGEFSEALQANEVDVAPLNEPRLTRYLEGYEDQGATFLTEEETEGPLSPGLSFLYAREEVLQDADLVAAVQSYVEHYIRAQQWVNDNPEEWIEAYFVDSQGVSAEEGERIVEEDGARVFPLLDDALIDQQQATIDLAWDIGELPNEVDANDMFDQRFNDVIEETVAEVGADHDHEELEE